ncbi:mannitol dehydrogenase family protein [Globicatella sulfidifaciens]
MERKLYTVNTGHATTAYFGFANGFDTIDHALAKEKVHQKVRKTLSETGQLLIEKWQFNTDEHQAYIETTLERFNNPALKDEVTRVGRKLIRKLGYNERFTNPIRQASERGLAIEGLIDTVVQILKYNDPADEKAVQLQAMLKEKSVEEVIKEVTQLQDQTIIDRIVKAYSH